MLRDVVELRANKWIPRREDYNPKTIDQIHKEAQLEKMQEQRLAAQMPGKDKQKKGGPSRVLVDPGIFKPRSHLRKNREVSDSGVCE